MFFKMILIGAAVILPRLAMADPVGFSTNDRNALNDYVKTLPASAKVQTEGQFRVGETLPHNTAANPLPANVAGKITPAPNGYAYIQSGTDVYLISTKNREIIDRVGVR